VAHVNVTIHGRKYRLNCADGEESHLMALADDLEQRIGRLSASFAQAGEMQLIVMAALMLADEAAEARARLASHDAEGASASSRGEDAARTEAAFAAALNAAAERIEQVTKSLNRSLGEGIPVG
jgi:cell division protein ZapA